MMVASGFRHLDRFALPKHLTLANFEGLDLGQMDKVTS